MPTDRRGGWLWRPLIGATISQVVLGIVRPTISYAALERGADTFVVGLVTASFAVIPMIIALPVGVLAGRMRRIAVVPLLSAAVMVAGALLASTTGDLASLTLASSLLGIGNLGVLLGCQSWIARSAPPSSYTAGFGWLTAGMSAGQAVGPLLGGLTIGTAASPEGISAAFVIAVVCSAAICAVFLSPASRDYVNAPPAERVGPLRMLRTPAMVRYVVVGATVLTAVDLVTAYLPVLGTMTGISPSIVGALLAVRGVTSMISRVFLGSLSRRFTVSSLIAASVFGAAGSLLVIALAPHVVVLFIAMAIGGLFLGMGQPLTMTAVALILPSRDRSTGLAVRLVGNRIAQTIVPIVAGAAAGSMGVAAVFGAQTAALVACGVWELARARRW